MKKKNILIACEYSGTVRDCFLKSGHNAISCDILPTEKHGPHHHGDVVEILYKKKWDLIIAHPPCTYMTNSGVRWLYKQGTKTRDKKRWTKLQNAAKFFRLFLDHPCEKIAIENPIPHRHAVELIGKKYTQIIHPYQFGHMEKKSTCLWLKGLPELKPTNDVKNQMMKLPKKEQNKIHYMSPGPYRWKKRSTTYQGIAQAMSDQWA